ncbi:NAD-dependent epimerase/dehydratase family protein [Nocardia yunnanensis]|uniref:NAD-dependent epimerase/dehydratase family protein n=1 Tax=Nocardia yunnanensis TaxID=2382165 RepID=A0A386ZLQ5_9NOCA|nr:NAD-dependent epimerase/dehydratase family protein [Nocardia yunnanensis]
MSEILVTGGTGVLGRLIVQQLREQGHEVRVLSRRTGAGTHNGDLTTGEGVAEALDGVRVVVHAATDARKVGRPDLRQTQNLLGAAASVEHIVYPSIVGIDRIPFRYYRNKLACEELIERSGIPHTIARATQFHELIASALHTASRSPIAPLPLDFRFQSVAAVDVAHHVAALAQQGPVGRIADFGGPEVLTLEQMLHIWHATHTRPRGLRLPVPGKIGRGFRAGDNTCPGQCDGVQTWAKYVESKPQIEYTKS